MRRAAGVVLALGLVAACAPLPASSIVPTTPTSSASAPASSPFHWIDLQANGGWVPYDGDPDQDLAWSPPFTHPVVAAVGDPNREALALDPADDTFPQRLTPLVVSLTLAHGNLHTASLSELRHWPNLRNVSLRGSMAVDSSTAFTILGTLPALERLDLAHTNLHDGDLIALADQLPHLVHLNIEDDVVTDAAIPALAKLPSLVSLRLSGTRIDDGAVKTLVQLSQLRSVTLSRTTITGAGLDALGALPSLRWLVLPASLPADHVTRWKAAHPQTAVILET